MTLNEANKLILDEIESIRMHSINIISQVKNISSETNGINKDIQGYLEDIQYSHEKIMSHVSRCAHLSQYVIEGE